MRHLPYGLADVSGPSMLPTLRPGDVVVVRWGGPVRPGDVVVLRHPGRPGRYVVKRVARPEPRGWWVVGDNPTASDDSRAFGPVAHGDVVARVLLRPWPPRLRGLRARARRR